MAVCFLVGDFSGIQPRVATRGSRLNELLGVGS